MKTRLLGHWVVSTNDGILEWMVLNGFLHKLLQKNGAGLRVIAAGKLTYRHRQMHGNCSIIHHVMIHVIISHIWS